MYKPARAFLLAAIVLVTSSLVFGQETTGSIEGTVKDAAGAVVPNITLTITNAKAAASSMTTTGVGAGFNDAQRHGGLETVDFGDGVGDAGLRRVALVLRQGHSSQDADGGHDDHQFDQGETLLGACFQLHVQYSSE